MYMCMYVCVCFARRENERPFSRLVFIKRIYVHVFMLLIGDVYVCICVCTRVYGLLVEALLATGRVHQVICVVCLYVCMSWYVNERLLTREGFLDADSCITVCGMCACMCVCVCVCVCVRVRVSLLVHERAFIYCGDHDQAMLEGARAY